MMSSDSDSNKRLRPLFSCPKILTFHKVIAQLSFGSTNFSPRRLRNLIRHLVDTGYSFETAERLAANPEPGKIALTFDDGYEHLKSILPELIDTFDIKPTVFFPTLYLGKSNSWDYSHYFRKDQHLDRESIKQLANLGVRFGSHGHRHVDLTSLNESELKEELETSRSILQDLIGEEITTISYPFGKCNSRITEMASDVGYTLGLTMAFPETSDAALTTGRYAVYGYDSKLAIMRKITGRGGHGLERAKARFTNRLGGGTVLLHRIRRSR